MSTNILDKIQPYIDEYCKAKLKYKQLFTEIVSQAVDNHVPDGKCQELIQLKHIWEACEKAIMQILFEENQLPTNPLI